MTNNFIQKLNNTYRSPFFILRDLKRRPAMHSQQAGRLVWRLFVIVANKQHRKGSCTPIAG